MKKGILFIGIAIAFSMNTAFGQTISEDAFWIIKLGSTKEQVKNIENQKKYTDENPSLVYKTKFLGLKGEATYEFDNDILVSKQFVVKIKGNQVNAKLEPTVRKIEGYMDTYAELVGGIEMEQFGGVTNSKLYKYENSQYSLYAMDAFNEAWVILTTLSSKE